MATLPRRFIELQRGWARRVDSALPEWATVDGNQEFVESIVPLHLGTGQKVYDVGGGKNPFLDPEAKARLDARVVGIDIDQEELLQAPRGAYDQVICTDISEFRGPEDGDLVICQALLEHVRDVPSAFSSIASILKPGGKAVIFVPNRNALFARLNLLLPERLKRRALFTIYPSTQRNQGFPAFYNHCTPNAFRSLAARNGLVVDDERYYFQSSYFSFLFPAYVVWRLWSLLGHALVGGSASETFTFVLRKQSEHASQAAPETTRS